jgi:peptide/nickel transport system substrate-binding protein
LACIAPVVGSGCGEDKPPVTGINIAASEQLGPIDPALGASVGATEATWLVYTPLLTYRHAEGPDGTTVAPGLAQDTPLVSAGGRDYRLRLRGGLDYSDGTPVRASDFEHEIKRVLALHSPGSGLFMGIDGARAYTAAGRREGDITGISANDRTGDIRIRLTDPDGTFENVLATTFSAPVPASTPFADRSGSPPPGVGLYRIARSVPGREFVLERNGRFDLSEFPQPELDTITVRSVGSPQRQTSEVSAGRLDYMQDTPPPALLKRVRDEHGDRFREFATGSLAYFFVNPGKPPFDRLEVRQAVNLAVDRREVVRLLGGLLEPGCNALPPTVPGYRRLDPCPYGKPAGLPQPARARQLVRRAGARDADVVVWGPRDGGSGAAITSYYARVLNGIGLRARARLVEFASYAQTVGNAATGAQTGFANFREDLPHPANFLRQFSGAAITPTESVNLGRVNDPEITAAIERLRQEPDPRRVEGQWAAVDRKLAERAYLVPLGYVKRTTFVSDRVKLDGCALVHPVYGNDLSSFCGR